MARIKRGIMIASTLMLVVVITSACKTPYSQAPAQTFTPVPQSNLFASAQPTTMGDISTFAAQTANAQLSTSPGAPVVSPTVGAGITPQAATATNTPLVSVNPTASATLAVPNGPSGPADHWGSRGPPGRGRCGCPGHFGAGRRAARFRSALGPVAAPIGGTSADHARRHDTQ